MRNVGGVVLMGPVEGWSMLKSMQCDETYKGRMWAVG